MRMTHPAKSSLVEWAASGVEISIHAADSKAHNGQHYDVRLQRGRSANEQDRGSTTTQLFGMWPHPHPLFSRTAQPHTSMGRLASRWSRSMAQRRITCITTNWDRLGWLPTRQGPHKPPTHAIRMEIHSRVRARLLQRSRETRRRGRRPRWLPNLSWRERIA